MLTVLLNQVRTRHAKSVEHEVHVERSWREYVQAVRIQRNEVHEYERLITHHPPKRKSCLWRVHL